MPAAQRVTRLYTALRQMDYLIQIRRPERMDHFVRFVMESGCLADYRVGFIIVRRHQIVKGVKIIVTAACNKRYILPHPRAHYLVTAGLQKYIDGGWKTQDLA